METKVYTTNKQPEDIAPFAMLPAFVWKLFDGGKLNLKELALYAILHRHVNPYEGKGRASYQRICTWMRLSPTDKNANSVNKMMARLRDELQLIYFPEHKGAPDFEYLLSDYQRGKKERNEAPDWVDIKPYFQTPKQNADIGIPDVHPEPMPRRALEIQMLENRNNGAIKSIGEIMEKSAIRPPYTDTNTQT